MTTLRILSGGAAEGLVAETAPAVAGRLTVEAEFSAVGALAARVRAGEKADIVIVTRALIDELAGAGHLKSDTAQDLGAVPTSVATRTSDGRPDVSSIPALRAALLDAPALFCPDIETSTGGRHVAWMIRELGLWAALEDRLNIYPNGATAMAALAASDMPGALGITQATEILNTRGVVRVADLPTGVALSTVYTAAVTTGSETPDQAAAFIAALASSAARARLGFAG